MSGQKNAYFANSLNTSHRLRVAPASIRKAAPRPAFAGERNPWRVCYPADSVHTEFRLAVSEEKQSTAGKRRKMLPALGGREEKCSEDRNGQGEPLASIV